MPLGGVVFTVVVFFLRVLPQLVFFYRYNYLILAPQSEYGYNHNKQNVVTNLYNGMQLEKTPFETRMEIVDELDVSVTRLIPGDFNLHHPMWQESTQTDAKSRQWVERINERQMILASQAGNATHIQGNAIDLVFADEPLSIEYVPGEKDVGMDLITI